MPKFGPLSVQNVSKIVQFLPCNVTLLKMRMVIHFDNTGTWFKITSSVCKDQQYLKKIRADTLHIVLSQLQCSILCKALALILKNDPKFPKLFSSVTNILVSGFRLSGYMLSYKLAATIISFLSLSMQYYAMYLCKLPYTIFCTVKDGKILIHKHFRSEPSNTLIKRHKIPNTTLANNVYSYHLHYWE